LGGCANSDGVAPAGGTGNGGGPTSGTSTSSSGPASGSGGSMGPPTIAATFRTLVKGTYLSAKGGALDAASATAGAAETFHITDLNGGVLVDGDEVFLASAGGTFVSAKDGGGDAVDAASTSPGLDETFVIVRIAGPAPIVAGDHVAFKTKQKPNYLSAIDGGGGQVRANAPWIKAWEDFTFNDDTSSSSTTGGGTGTTDYAPYFPTWTWDDPGTYPYANLVDLRNKTGMPGVTLAFVLSGGGCYTDGDVLARVDDIKAFAAMGGQVKASFGGAAGTYLEASCGDPDSLAAAIGDFVDQTGITDLDFDIEQDAAYGLSSLRGQALKKVQDAKGIRVSFTLPTNPDGLAGGGIQVVQGALDAGVQISHVNLMTMDYGEFHGQPLGPVAIQSVEAAKGQLQAMIAGLTDAKAYAMLGATPMIGANDTGEMFSLDDATLLAQFARDKKLGLVSFWAISRDRVCNTGKDGCSTVNSGSYDFHNILKTSQQ
jgi:chitinase